VSITMGRYYAIRYKYSTSLVGRYSRIVEHQIKVHGRGRKQEKESMYSHSPSFFNHHLPAEAGVAKTVTVDHT